MTENEWLGCTDPTPMLELLKGKSDERRMRLLACACCRRIWPKLTDQRSRNAIEVAERFADGEANRHELKSALDEAQAAYRDAPIEQGVAASLAATFTTRYATMSNAVGCSASASGTTDGRIVIKECLPEKMFQTRIIGDVFGNPFRPVSLNSVWLNSTVANLARSAYDERAMPSGELDPARLAVLSDALEEAGCDSEDILAHLRGPRPHVRGCWVLDWLLGKA